MVLQGPSRRKRVKIISPMRQIGSPEYTHGLRVSRTQAYDVFHSRDPLDSRLLGTVDCVKTFRYLLA